MTKEPHVISQKAYDTAVRLFAAMRNHYAKARALEDQIGKVIRIDDIWDTHVADLVFAEKVTEKKFKLALSRDGITVEDLPSLGKRS